MSNGFLLSVFVLAAAVGCNRKPAPESDHTAESERNTPGYQANQPSPGNTSGSSALGAEGTTGMNGGGTSASEARTTLAKLDDSQIARITDAANSAEIEQGKLAQAKAKDARVKEFAQRMVKHHTAAKDKQAKLKLTTSSSDAAMKLERDADKTLSDLKSASASDFDTNYMAAQVEEHQHVLDTIDKDLLPNAKADELKAYLHEIRPTVEAHLKDARAIQSKLSQQASSK